MKKSIFLILLLTLSIGSVSVFASSVYKEHNNVTFEETVLYGDSSVMDGLNISINTHYLENVYWNTSLHFGESIKSDTQYRFYPLRQTYDYPTPHEGLVMNTVSDYPFTTSGDNKGIARAYYNLFHSLEPGEEKEQSIYLKDYMDYYDFEVFFDFPNADSWHYRISEAASSDYSVDYYLPHNDDLLNLREYFKIPVLEEETHTFSLSKDFSGHLTHIGGGTTQSDYFNLDLKSIMTEDTCYFTFNPYSFEGKAIDTSLLPEGFGVFALPYDANSKYEDVVKSELLSMVYPIDTNVKVFDLQINEDQTILFLYTIEDNQMVLSIIEIATMKTIQKQVIADLSEGNALSIAYNDNVILITNRSNNTLSIFAETEKKEYQLEFACTFDPEDDFFSRTYYAPQFDYNGERLVLACVKQYWQQSRAGFCNFFVSVYTKDGLQYIGEYENSLDSGIDNEIYDYPTRTDHHDAFEISWQ